MNASIIEHQIRQCQLRAQVSALRIQSGVYKTRIVHKGSHDGPLYNEAELLDDEFKTMDRHLHRADDLIDTLCGLLNPQNSTPRGGRA